MGINVGMLIFGLFDSALAFFLVYCLWVSWLKGKRIGQILGIIFGTLVFTTYLTLFIWFNSLASGFVLIFERSSTQHLLF